MGLINKYMKIENYGELLAKGLEWYKQLRIDDQNSIYKTQDLINLLPQLQEDAKIICHYKK